MLHYKVFNRCLTLLSHSVYYQRDEGGTATVITNQEQMNTYSKAVGRTSPDMPFGKSKMESSSAYQQLTSSTTPSKGDHEDMPEMKQGIDEENGLHCKPGDVSLDEQVYDTCT